MVTGQCPPKPLLCNGFLPRLGKDTRDGDKDTAAGRAELRNQTGLRRLPGLSDLWPAPPSKTQDVSPPQQTILGSVRQVETLLAPSLCVPRPRCCTSRAQMPSGGNKPFFPENQQPPRGIQRPLSAPGAKPGASQ